MKKILLFIAGLMLAMSASAQLYLRGAINNWGNGAEWQFTETETGVFVLEKSFTLSGEFKVADGTWSTADNYGAGDQAEVSAGVAVAAVNGSNTNFKVSSGKAFAVSKIVFDKNALTLTVYAQEEELVDDFAYFLHGSFASSDWASEALTESNGVWSISDFVVAQDADFGVKRTNNGFQDAWYWTVAGLGTDVSATGTYQLGEEKTATEGGNPSIKAGTYTISFDPATLILTVTASGSSDEGEGGDDIVPTSEYYMAGAPVEGTDWVCGENWNPAGCPLENGTKEFANLPAGEYKFKITNGAWPNAEGTGGSCWGFADLANAEGLTEDADANVVITLAEPSNVSVSFDGTLITVVITPAQATDLEDVDAEDAVVAAYDITGKPVAADAKGLVILQYASGKAVKIFN